MAENSSIEWTDATFCPWWGCVKVSEACRNCYAATFAGRFGVEWGPVARRRFQSGRYWEQPLKWDRAAAKAGERRRVFCASMADVFELLPDRHPDAEQMGRERLRLWKLIEATPNLDWLLLTKRPENVLGMTPAGWNYTQGFPPNVWIGTTVEGQNEADKRIPHLLEVPAAVRFLSCEPLLGPLDLTRYLERYYQRDNSGRIVNWVITGGESGPGARPSHPDWFRSLRDQCRAAGVPFHFKQHGDWAPLDMLWPRTFDEETGLFAQRGCPPYSQWGTLDRTGKWWDQTTPWASDVETGFEFAMARVGKKVAGRVLDGRTWDEFPQVAQ